MTLKKGIVKIIALTGGIGTGKSTVGNFIRTQNIPVIDADQLSREVCKAGLPAYSEIVTLVGSDILLPSKELDRAKLKNLIFSDTGLKKKVEAIIHPKIQGEFIKKIDELNEKKESIVFYEIPLLFESSSKHDFHSVVCVDAPDQIRIERITKQRNISEEVIKKIIAFQKPQEEKKQLSDYVIDNGSNLKETKRQVLELIKRIQSSS